MSSPARVRLSPTLTLVLSRSTPQHPGSDSSRSDTPGSLAPRRGLPRYAVETILAVDRLLGECLILWEPTRLWPRPELSWEPLSSLADGPMTRRYVRAPPSAADAALIRRFDDGDIVDVNRGVYDILCNGQWYELPDHAFSAPQLLLEFWARKKHVGIWRTQDNTDADRVHDDEDAIIA